MLALVKTYETTVWLILALITSLSRILADGYVPQGADAALALSMGLIVLAFIKVRLVIMYFMEVKHAPLALRILMEVWCVAVCGGILFLLMQSGQAS